MATGISRSALNNLQSANNQQPVDDQDGDPSMEVDEPLKLSRTNIRCLIFYEFKKNQSEKACLTNINTVFGEGTVAKTCVNKYYQRFAAGNFDLEDEERSGRPVEVDNEVLQQMIFDTPSIIVEDLAEALDVSEQTVRNHLKQLGYTCKLDKWVPHDLSPFNKYTRVRVCRQLIEQHRKFNFFPYLITCDEKQVYFNNQEDIHSPSPSGASQLRRCLCAATGQCMASNISSS